MGKCPECSGGDEFREGRWEIFWVRALRLGGGEGEGDEETEEEPSEERSEGNKRVEANQTWV